MSAKRVIRNEFKARQFNFLHFSPLDFASWSWDTKRNKICGYFVIYRLFLAALFLSILVSYGSRSENPEFFFIYLTNLGFLIQTLHLVVSALLPIQYLLQSANDTEGIHWTIVGKFSWFLYNATNMTTIVITVIYWIVLYEPGRKLEAMNFLVHGFNSIVSVVDVFVSGRPCRLMHFYHPIVIFLAYTSFSAIYWAAGGRTEDGLSYIYPVLNWENLALTVPFVAVGFFVALPLLQLLFWGMHLLRDYVFLNGNKRSRHSQASDASGQNNYGYDYSL